MGITTNDIAATLAHMEEAGELARIEEHAPDRRERNAVRSFRKRYEGFAGTIGRMPFPVVCVSAPRTVLAGLLCELVGDGKDGAE